MTEEVKDALIIVEQGFVEPPPRKGFLRVTAGILPCSNPGNEGMYMALARLEAVFPTRRVIPLDGDVYDKGAPMHEGEATEIADAMFSITKEQAWEQHIQYTLKARDLLIRMLPNLPDGLSYDEWNDRLVKGKST